MNTCKTCKHRDKDGDCTSNKLADDWGQNDEEKSDMLIYSYSEGGSFWVGENFGCVHHTLNSELTSPPNTELKRSEELWT